MGNQHNGHTKGGSSEALEAESLGVSLHRSNDSAIQIRAHPKASDTCHFEVCRLPSPSPTLEP
eukprot:10922188-Karenia_brevis.AAC.1